MYIYECHSCLHVRVLYNLFIPVYFCLLFPICTKPAIFEHKHRQAPCLPIYRCVCLSIYVSPSPLNIYLSVCLNSGRTFAVFPSCASKQASKGPINLQKCGEGENMDTQGGKGPGVLSMLLKICVCTMCMYASIYAAVMANCVQVKGGKS